MIKKNKGVIILLLTIVLLVAAYFVIININDNSGEINSGYELTEIYNIDSADINKIEFISEAESYTLVYDDNVSISELAGAYIDENKAKETRTSLSFVSTEEIISEDSNNLNEYGLENPALKVKIWDINGNVKEVLIGDASPVGNGYYAKLIEDGKIFILDNYKYDYFSKKSSYYRTVSFFEVDKTNITDITLDVYGKHTLIFKENVVADTNTPHNVFSKYQMISPFNWEASADMVGKILDSVTQLEVLEYAAENTDKMSDFGFSPYVAKLTFVHDGGVQDTVYFGNNKEGIIYIRTEKDNRIYGINSEPFSYLPLDPFSYLSDFAFLRNIMTVKHISYSHNNTNAEFYLTGVDEQNVDVKKDGKLMSQDKFKELYSELISIGIDGVYSGVFPGKPFLTYTFDYNDMTTEKVEFYKIDERRAALSVNGKSQFYVNLVELNMKLEKIDAIINNN